jgi:hypothetical protein
VRPALAASATAAPAADPLGAALAEIASALQAHSLLEVENGAVLSHTVIPAAVPDAFASAVVRRSISELAGSVTARRAIGVISGGPIVSARHPEWPAKLLIAPVPGERPAWLWLLTTRRLQTTEVDWATKALRDALLRTQAVVDPLRAALFDSAPLAADVLPVGSRWLVAIGTDDRVVIEEVRRSLGLASRAVTEQDMTYVLLGADPDTDVLARLRAALRVRGAACGGAVLTRVSDDQRGLTDLRESLDEALAEQRPRGGCRLLADCRAAVVLARLGPVLDATDGLAGDAVRRLLAQDATRGTQFASTALAWLDAHGDAVAAAAAIPVHPNTFRYRLMRVRTLLGDDLQDPDVRLELHLRLRRRLLHS